MFIVPRWRAITTKWEEGLNLSAEAKAAAPKIEQLVNGIRIDEIEYMFRTILRTLKSESKAHTIDTTS